MSILIKGMKMPKSCESCMFSRRSIRNIDWCVLTERDLPCECPISEVPPHGRLIDADALRENIKESRKRQPEIADDYFIVANWLRSAPTIIEKEDDGT